MSARMRIGWGFVALLWAGGSPAGADPVRGDAAFPVSEADLTTWFPTWRNPVPHRASWGSGYDPAPRPVTPAAVPPAPVYHAPAPVPVPVPASAPAPAPAAPVFTPPSAPQVFATTATAAAPPVAAAPAPAPAPAADAFVNTGAGPYPEADLITSGGARPWSESAQITALFGGAPDARQQAAFTGAVMQEVRQTFADSGVTVALTGDPNARAGHALSLVSNTVPTLLPTAIGMTDVGANGFSFIDQEAKSAQNLDQLERIVAHNIAHELMLAFGVGENYDTSGNYIDARNASLSMMLDPHARFSPAAAAALNQALAAANPADGSGGTSAAQVVEPRAVPEPGAAAVWVAGLLALAAIRARARARHGDRRAG